MNKTLFVTGATRNTGLAIARRFAADGWNVIVSSRRAADAEKTAGELGAEFPGVETLGVGMDPARTEDIRGAFAAIAARFGRLDAFVNCAAHLGVGLSVFSTKPEDYNAVMDANVKGPLFAAQAAQALMTAGGSIVFISSCHAKGSVPGRLCYTVSKAAIGGLTRSLAVELGHRAITVNAILAGAIRTDRWDPLTDEQIAERRRRWPTGKESTGDDIAAAVAYLCSDAARTVTGTEIPVDSGVGACLLQYKPDWVENDTYNVKYWEKK